MTAPPDRPRPGVSLFAWVKQELLASIERGEFTPDQPFVTQREIVERFEVSTTTAIRALNELVADGVVVRKRGRGTFVAPPSERAAPVEVAPGHGVLTYVSPDAGSSHESVLLAGLAAESAELGYRVTVEHTRDVAHEEQVLRALAGRQVQGVVLFARERSTAAGAIERLRRTGRPVVLVDRYLPGLPTDAVLFDDAAVGHAVTTLMIERGHRSLGVLWSECEVTSVRDRLAGHLRALHEHGLPEWPERCGLRRYDGLDRAARLAWLRSWLDAGTRPTALVCGNSPTLALAVSDMLAMDTGFTGSVELASMDQSLPLDVSPLAVAAARLPTREMGQEAARLVHARVRGSTEPLRHVVLTAEVQVADRGRNTLGVIGAHR